MTVPATNDTTPTPHEAALSYAARGWRVLPIIPGKKSPPMRAWQDAATTNPETIDAWWTGLYRGHGVGIATGQESGVWVLDVDVADGKTGDETLRDLEDIYGELPPTIEAVTGRGGRHLFFRWPESGDIRAGAAKLLGEGLDVRGVGGQVVAAPTVAPSGGRYEWLIDHGPDEVELAEAPGWLLEMMKPEVKEAPESFSSPSPNASEQNNDDSPAAIYNARTTWDELLTADGWTLARTEKDGEQRWVRPGKDARDGISATVGHQGRDVLKVFTSSVPGLVAEQAYSRFGYTAAMHYGGDRSAFARELRAAMPRPVDPEWDDIAPTAVDVVTGEPVEVSFVDQVAELAHLVEWSAFWSDDRAEEEWLCYPLIPKGRAVALYAPAKAGKSSVVLAVVAAAATGRPVLGGRKVEPVRTLYLDYEMTTADLAERLGELGYGPEDDLSHLHYALLPSLQPLDTLEGAQAVVRLARHLDVELVVVDTFGRAVAGDEDKADTVRAFYRHTGLALKAAGVAVLRTDHSGKELERGQRGSSAKADDVDVVWQLSRTDSGVKLKRTHSRVSWVPDALELTRHDDGDGSVRWSTATGSYPAGTKEKAKLLDDLGVPVDASQRVARAALKEAGEKCSNSLLSAALRYRSKALADLEIEAVEVRNTPAEHPNGQKRNTSAERGGTLAKPLVSEAEHPTEHHGTPAGPKTEQHPSLERGAFRGRSPEVQSFIERMTSEPDRTPDPIPATPTVDLEELF